jgi:hypothetical protein
MKVLGKERGEKSIDLYLVGVNMIIPLELTAIVYC